ncbi:MAG: NAD(P)-binding protein [Bacillota bacterium]
MKKYLLNQIAIGIDEDVSLLKTLAAKTLGINLTDIYTIKIVRKSIDARRKGRIQLVYSLCVETSSKVDLSVAGTKEIFEPTESKLIEGTSELRGMTVVVGSGPAGLFAALELARQGYNPLVIERGECVEKRTKKVEAFWLGGELDLDTNTQFGEGGAGTFSDGKLTTRIGDPLSETVLQQFVKAGASKEILFDAKPHIGSDVLKYVIPNIRKEIEKLGGVFKFNTKLTDLKVTNSEIKAIKINSVEWIDVGAVVLAIGHSARDTFEILLNRGMDISQKAFSVGVRIEHPQELIDKAQYGNFAGHPAIGAADYQLFTRGGERTAYTFCMCPGGEVVAADSEYEGLVTNGMSQSNRALANANSAFVVAVRPNDFADKSPLSGVYFQRQIEQKAYKLGNGAAPIQKLGDFITDKVSNSKGLVKTSYTRATECVKMDEVFPVFVCAKMREAIPDFENKLKGFAFSDALLIAPETRTSSPIRMNREDDGTAISIAGLYPAGEGAGYAGGIMSAAIDGIKAARKIISKYRRT